MKLLCFSAALLSVVTAGPTVNATTGFPSEEELRTANNSTWTSCSGGGGTGTCIDTSTHKCAGGVLERNLCPGGNNQECCMTSWGSCTAKGKAGQCVVGTACKGSLTAGLCPGPSEVECCTNSGPGPSPSPPTPGRAGVVLAAHALYNNRAEEHYTEGSERWSGIDNKVYPPAAPKYSDCSAAVTWCYWTVFGNGPDFLNDQNWKAGYTGSMSGRGKVVVKGHGDLGPAQPGDLVFYGSPIHHVAIYVGNGKVISHGEDPVDFVEVDYRSDRAQINSYL